MVRGPLYHRFWTLAKGLLLLAIPRDVRAAEARDDGFVYVHGNTPMSVECGVDPIRLKNALEFAHERGCFGLHGSAKSRNTTSKGAPSGGDIGVQEF